MADIRKVEASPRKVPEVAMDSSFISSVASITAMVLAVIALGGIRTYWMAALVSIAVGLAQLFEGEALCSRVSSFMCETARKPSGDVGRSVVTGRLPGGVAGIVLGILALFAVLPRILLPVAAILFGVVLIMGAGTVVHLSDVYTEKACLGEETRAVTRAGVRIVETLEVFIGCGGVALGILALTGFGFSPVTLTFVAMLGIAFSSLLNSTIFSSRVLGSLQCDSLK